MLARKGIFVKPSILQFVRQHDRATPKDLQSKAYCRYYTTNPGGEQPAGILSMFIVCASEVSAE